MFIGSYDGRRTLRTRSLSLILLAWVFIGGQALLVAGSIFNLDDADQKATESKMPWRLLGQSAAKTRTVAMQARPDLLGDVVVFLAAANALGIAGLVCGLLSWTRSEHVSGRLTIAAAATVIVINSILNLPYA